MSFFCGVLFVAAFVIIVLAFNAGFKAGRRQAGLGQTRPLQLTEAVRERLAEMRERGLNLTTLIKPGQIDIQSESWLPNSVFGNTFGLAEAEWAARYLVWMSQERGDWYPFSYSEANEYYKRTPVNSMSSIDLELLIDNGYILVERLPGDGKLYLFTDQFVEKCYTAWEKQRDSKNIA